MNSITVSPVISTLKVTVLRGMMKHWSWLVICYQSLGRACLLSLVQSKKS